MEQIIEKIKAVLGEILRIKTSLEAERNKVANVGRKQENVAMRQADKEVEFGKREAAIKPIEDVVAFKAAAEKVAKESTEGRISLEKERRAFDALRKNELAKIMDKKAEVEKKEKMYDRQLAGLKKAREDLAKEAAGIKGKVLGELAKNI